MAAPTIYRSDDGSAPVISGQSSALRLALNAILVDGYGSKPAAGWTKPYEDAGTHLVAYQNAGRGRYLYLNDSDARLASVRGYHKMTSITALAEGPFPGLSLTTVHCRKSVTADSTGRAWICLANERHFFLIIFGNQTTLGSFDGGDAHLAFGELDSELPGDEWNTFIHASPDTSTTSTTATTARQGFCFNNVSGALNAPHVFCDGTYAQSGTPILQVIPTAVTPYSEIVSGGTTFPAYPDAVTGKLLISRQMARMNQSGSSSGNRGYLPGLWVLCHPIAGVTSLDTFSGGGSLAGRNFLIVKTGAGGVVFETTAGSW